jgi:hypothetical protein
MQTLDLDAFWLDLIDYRDIYQFLKKRILTVFAHLNQEYPAGV